MNVSKKIKKYNIMKLVWSFPYIDTPKISCMLYNIGGDLISYWIHLSKYMPDSNYYTTYQKGYDITEKGVHHLSLHTLLDLSHYCSGVTLDDHVVSS